ncbi:aspartate/glutamate racemase family protein [Pelobacter seleniigenes]|uniref:aspartate/glutamate racemase family protein n=1 Tax=Pelobacter seleniigenes TaxID=407188 RepID=UPI0004A77A11|nr:aspartate/glutamate racemase family protein [Pelobacter seleniigenes]
MQNSGGIVTIVHTSFVSVDDLTALFKELGPEIQLRHIVDDSLLPEVLANGGVTSAVRSRICAYYRAAEDAGSDLIFNQCSSVGEAADIAAQLITTPVVKVDEEMARIACRTSRKIAVAATLETTLGPTCRLLEKTALAMQKEIAVEPLLVNGAFAELVSGNRQKHNDMVLTAIRGALEQVDAVVCAQGSMVAILPELGQTKVPVLTSPRTGVAYAVAELRKIMAQKNH